MKRLKLALMLVLLAACVKHGPSEVCEDDSECEGELSCMQVSVYEGGVCEELSSVCTESCVDDSDCEHLGDDMRCFEQCDGVSLCTRAEEKTDDLPASAVCEETESCAEGLECLPVVEHGVDECTEVGMACSITCEDDSDCSDLGDNFRCFESCDGDPSVCGATG